MYRIRKSCLNGACIKPLRSSRFCDETKITYRHHYETIKNRVSANCEYMLELMRGFDYFQKGRIETENTRNKRASSLVMNFEAETIEEQALIMLFNERYGINPISDDEARAVSDELAVKIVKRAAFNRPDITALTAAIVAREVSDYLFMQRRSL